MKSVEGASIVLAHRGRDVSQQRNWAPSDNLRQPYYAQLLHCY